MRGGHHNMRGVGDYGLLSLGEVAERLGWNRRTVESLWLRGIKKLQQEPETMDWIRKLANAQRGYLTAGSVECRSEWVQRFRQ